MRIFCEVCKHSPKPCQACAEKEEVEKKKARKFGDNRKANTIAMRMMKRRKP